MANPKFNDEQEIIDVAYQTATDDELFGSQTQAAPPRQQQAAFDENEEALE